MDLIIDSQWLKFPPRLAGQPIFYPVLNEAYAEQITREWNVPTYGIGHVLRFEVQDDYLSQFKVQKVGLDHHLEFWIPSEDLYLKRVKNLLFKEEILFLFSALKTGAYLDI